MSTKSLHPPGVGRAIEIPQNCPSKLQGTLPDGAERARALVAPAKPRQREVVVDAREFRLAAAPVDVPQGRVLTCGAVWVCTHGEARSQDGVFVKAGLVQGWPCTRLVKSGRVS